MSPTPNSPTADVQQAIADLQRQLAEARAERDDSEAQKAAIAEVLGVINSSPGDLAPVFDAMLEKAMRLCAAAFGYLETYDGEHFHPVATRGLPAAYADYLPQRDAPGSSSSYAQILGGAPYAHVADLREGEAHHTSPLRQALVDLGGARSSWSGSPSPYTGVDELSARRAAAKPRTKGVAIRGLFTRRDNNRIKPRCTLDKTGKPGHRQLADQAPWIIFRLGYSG